MPFRFCSQHSGPDTKPIVSMSTEEIGICFTTLREAVWILSDFLLDECEGKQRDGAVSKRCCRLLRWLQTVAEMGTTFRRVLCAAITESPEMIMTPECSAAIPPRGTSRAQLPFILSPSCSSPPAIRNFTRDVIFARALPAV